jgi:hypothetical protein
MKRVSAFVAFVVVLAIVAVIPSTGAQDTTEHLTFPERITALEEKVVELEGRIAALEEASGGTGATAREAVTSEASETVSEGAISLSGPGGQQTTEIVSLGGAYVISATCEAGYFSTDTLNVDNPDDFVHLSVYGRAPYDGSTVENLDPARYIFSVECDGAWTLTFEPLE